MFKSFIFVLLLIVYGAKCCNVTSLSAMKVDHCSYLDVALELIQKAKENMPGCCSCPGNPNPPPVDPENKPKDCADLLQEGFTISGVYQICPVHGGKPFKVYCDMDTDGGGWTVIQRRGNFQNAKDYFNQNWTSYKEGFGDLKKEFWLGNDYIFALTSQKPYSVRFDLMDVEQEKKFAHYEKFEIGDEEDNYVLSISDHSGDTGDSMISLNNQTFSTKDRDNRKSVTGCKRDYEGGWWYSPCHRGSLNGLYHYREQTTRADGIHWQAWKGTQESLEWTEIKIRPSNSD